MIGKYPYYALNTYYAKIDFRNKGNLDVLGYGAGNGAELRDIIANCKRICIVDPNFCDFFSDTDVEYQYYYPSEDGVLPFEDEMFDLITCFGVLMYIMNPENVLEEMIRVLKKGGVLLIREPSTDMHLEMGTRRFGMGKYTRGIEKRWFQSFFSQIDCIIYRISPCMFSPLVRVGSIFMKEPLNHKWFVMIDSVLSRLFEFNSKYYRKSFWDKFSPGSNFIKCIKNDEV